MALSAAMQMCYIYIICFAPVLLIVQKILLLEIFINDYTPIFSLYPWCESFSLSHSVFATPLP